MKLINNVRIIWRLALICTLLFPGCGPKIPSSEDVLKRITAQIPPFLIAESIEVRTTADPATGSVRVGFSVVVKPVEDLYNLGSWNGIDEVHVEIVSLSAENQMGEQAFKQAVALAADFPLKNTLLSISAQKDEQVTLHGSILAARTDSGWQWGDADFTDAKILRAKPRSSFDGKTYIDGTPEASAALDELKRGVEAIKVSEREKRLRAQEELQAKQQVILNMFTPGTKLSGNIKSDRWPDRIDLLVSEDSSAEGSPLIFSIRNPQDENQVRVFSGYVDIKAATNAKAPVAVASSDNSSRLPKGASRSLFSPENTIYRGEDLSIKLFLSQGGLLGRFSGYAGPTIELRQDP